MCKKEKTAKMLNRNFLHTETELFKIPKSRLIIGLLAGLFFAFCFYAFMYLTRESFRLVSLTEDYDLWTLTDKEVGFYNLFFAFVSVIFAQSISFSFWFDKPQNIFSKRKFQRILIGKDQSALNTYFLFWFSELAVIYGLTFGSTYIGGFYVFSFYPKYNYIFVFIILVLFLQTWNSIRRINKKQSLKWLFISMLVVSTIAFGLSKVNLIDYKSINNIALQKNILFKYTLDKPKSSCYESKFENPFYVKKIFIVKNDEAIDSNPKLFIDNEEVNLDALCKKILEFSGKFNEDERGQLLYNLHIDKSIKMKYINELRTKLASVDACRIAYAVIPINQQYDKRYYRDTHFAIRIPKFTNEDFGIHSVEMIYYSIYNIENIVEVRAIKPNLYEINNSFYTTNNIKQQILNAINTNPNYIIKYYINDKTEFGDYLNVLTKAYEAVKELRQKYSFAIYKKDYDCLNSEESDSLRLKFLFRTFELTAEISERFNDY